MPRCKDHNRVDWRTSVSVWRRLYGSRRLQVGLPCKECQRQRGTFLAISGFLLGFWCALHRATREKAMPRGEKSKYTDKQERKAEPSSKATKTGAFLRRRPNVARGRQSTTTTAEENALADRAAASRPAIQQRTRAAGLAAPHRPRDRRRADQQRRKRRRLLVSGTPGARPARAWEKSWLTVTNASANLPIFCG
jgi:hypothetical protein